MRLKKATVSQEHKSVYKDLAALIARHAEGMTALEVLVIAGNIVGKLVAMQDQRTVTPTMAMEIVLKNIEAGNAEALAIILQSKGTA